jgi:hypothetical protein
MYLRELSSLLKKSRMRRRNLANSRNTLLALLLPRNSSKEEERGCTLLYRG